MRMPRFRIRTLMVAVAVIALLIGVPFDLARRRRAFLRLAIEHQAREVAVTYDGYARVWFDSRGRPLDPRAAKLDLWNSQLADKYFRAARYPWLSVEPDPPEPK